MPAITVSALYKFVLLEDFQARKSALLSFCQNIDVKGTLLLAREGINGTIAGTEKQIDAVLGYLRSDPRLSDLSDKRSTCEEMPFLRMKVKLKKEIVSIGLAEISPTKKVGQYVEAADWNRLISDPEVLLIDTRNDYEVDIGTFSGAINPRTDNFREFPDYVNNALKFDKNKKIAMFCTGGIRCEKASSLMLEYGFKQVYHLKGGILKYLETVKEADSLWHGECFVFDQRISVKHDLKQGTYQQCYGCRHPIDAADIASADYEKGVHCPHCIDAITDKKRSRFSQRQLQVDLAKARNEKHIASYYQRHHSDTHPQDKQTASPPATGQPATAAIETTSPVISPTK